jgi:uncharacterized surface protein with fasciclin (FAS1) repeats
MRFLKKIVVPLAFVASIISCKKWEGHTDIGTPDLQQDLLATLSANPNLSKFREYVNKAGLDSLLQSSKTYTVWAPVNDALTTLDPAIINDTEKLRNFVRNHIANLSWFTRDAATPIRVAMLNGKYQDFSSSTFDEATITAADKFVKNGVLHTINKRIEVKQSIWEFITGTTTTYLQNKFVAGLNFEDFDPTLATIDSISSTTGQPIYHPGTGIVVRNRFNTRIYDTKNEQKRYTYFVITDPEFIKESDSLKVYFTTGNALATDSLAKWAAVRDLAVEGLYPATALTGLLSKFGAPLPLNAGFIVETRKMSNGIVHIFSKIDVLNADKFKPITIQGESPSGFLADRTSNTNYRVRLNPATGLDFTDILVSGHNLTSYYSYYRLNEVPSIKYRVYAFGVNDFQTGVFAQNIVPKSFVAPSTYTTLATLVHNVPLFSAVGAYNEILLGEFTVTNYGTLEIQLTATTTNPIVLDYIRLVPVP